MEAVLAVGAGLLIGLTLGALGGGGSILAVPVLVYLLGESPVQATTGSLVVVGTTAVIGAVSGYRHGNVLLARGLTFGGLSVGGAVAGARLSTHVDEDVLLAAFAGLMLVVGGLMLVRQFRQRGPQGPATDLDQPILQVRPSFHCDCPRALKLLVTATAVGMLTGFLGVGGGFLVVPALVLVLGLSMRHAAATSLVVIAISSAAALVVRVGVGVQPDWAVVLLLTLASAVGAVLGARVASRVDPQWLSGAFTALVIIVALYTASQAFPALV